MRSVIDKLIDQAALDAAVERFEAAVALCRAIDLVVQLTPRTPMTVGPVTAHHAEVARQAVAACERRYLDTTETASRYASAAGRFPSSRELVSTR